jgi:translocation and assembly module TamB
MTTPPTDPEMSAVKRSRKRLILKSVAWLVASVATLTLLAAFAIAILLHSDRFHRYVLNTVQQRASEALGVRVQVQNFALHLSNLGVDLYGLTVDGASPYANPPLLQVDHVEVSARIVSILHGKWYLDDVRVDRPIARIFVDAQGRSNIPTIKSSGGSSNTNLFDLAIRHAILDRGEVYYNDKQSVLAADLHDVEFRASFDSLLQKYSGRLAYSDGHFATGALRTVPHSLDAEFDATPTTFRVTRARLTSGASHLDLSATLQNYNAPAVDAHYDTTIDGEQVGRILQDSAIPTGQLRAAGTIHFQKDTNGTLLDGLRIDGDLNSRRIDLKTSSMRAQVDNLAAHYSLAHGNFTLQNLHGNVFGGYLTAAGTMSDVAGDSHSKVSAEVRNVSLVSLKRSLGKSASTPDLALKGLLNAKANVSWGKTLDDLVVQTDATIHGQVTGHGQVAGTGDIQSAATPATPLDGVIHGKYTASNGEIAVSKSYLRTAQTSLTMNGVVSRQSSLAVRLQADDLREVEALADLFRTPQSGRSLQPLGLAGSASFDGTVQGSTSAPHLSGQLVATNLHVSGAEFKTLRTQLDASPSSASLEHADIELASHGSISFNGRTGLSHWAFTENSPVQVDLDAKQLSLAELAKLSGQQIPVTGTLNAVLKLHGTELNPVGNGSVSLTGVTAYEQPVQSVKIVFSGTGDEAHGDLDVELPAGTVKSTVSVRPHERTYTAQLTATGIRLDKLQALTARNVHATGVLGLSAHGEGIFDNPQATATLEIPQLVIQNQTITGLDLQVNVADHVANATLASLAANTSIAAKARVNLSGDYLADASLDTKAIPLQPLFSLYAPEQAASLTGQTEVHATLHGPLKDKALLEVHVTIPQLKLGYNDNLQLAAASPIHIDYKDGVVRLERASIRGTDTDLQFQGSIPTTGSGQMSLMLLGTVNLQLAQLFDPDISTSGELKFNINSSGSANDPNVGGQIEIVNAGFSSDDLPVGLEHGNGTLSVTRDRLSITKFQGSVGGGTVTAQGGVTLQRTIQFDLGLAAQNLRALYPQGVRESADANLRLTGSMESAVLSGVVNLSDVSFTSAFDLNNFISEFGGGISSPPTPGFSQNLRLNLALRSSNNVRLVSRTLSVDGTANLQVRGTAANPVILGRVNLNNGDVILNGDRFVLDGGTIEFVNPSETEAVVNLSLKTTIQQYDVYLRFNGPLDQLRTNYSSDPSLPTADIINLLAFGNTTEATTTTSPTSVIASQVSSQVTSRFSKIAGISQLSINPILANGNGGQTGANITIQQRVTSNLFVTFSTNVAATESQTIQGQYQLSPRVALSATRDPNGGFAFDVLIKKTW